MIYYQNLKPTIDLILDFYKIIKLPTAPGLRDLFCYLLDTQKLDTTPNKHRPEHKNRKVEELWPIKMGKLILFKYFDFQNPCFGTYLFSQLILNKLTGSDTYLVPILWTQNPPTFMY